MTIAESQAGLSAAKSCTNPTDQESGVPTGEKMENQIVCPNCNKTISNNAVIEDAANGKGSDIQSIRCDCGERITYWTITAQLRKQKTFGIRFKNWFRSLSHGVG